MKLQSSVEFTARSAPAVGSQATGQRCRDRKPPVPGRPCVGAKLHQPSITSPKAASITSRRFCDSALHRRNAASPPERSQRRPGRVDLQPRLVACAPSNQTRLFWQYLRPAVARASEAEQRYERINHRRPQKCEISGLRPRAGDCVRPLAKKKKSTGVTGRVCRNPDSSGGAAPRNLPSSTSLRFRTGAGGRRERRWAVR
jgi:hypothetical protein